MNLEIVAKTNQKPEALSLSTKNVLQFYEETIKTPQTSHLGQISKLTPMYEGETPPLALRNYRVKYPLSLIQAYQIACSDYDMEFMKLVEKSKLWPTDYQYANYTFAFQVDGPAYPDDFLKTAAEVNPKDLVGLIKTRAFEFESNIAMYDLNHRLWPDGTTNQTWHWALDNIRKKTGKKVAVLAGTEQKLNEMLMYELGIDRNHLLSEEEIKAKTGFDNFLGPNDLVDQFNKYGGNDSDYIYFGRTSRPKTWLKDPTTHIDEGIFADPNILRFVRAYAITHNFDDPNLPLNDPSIMMDTKEALLGIGSAYLVTHPKDVYSNQFIQHLTQNGIDMEDVHSGKLTPNQKKKLGEIFLKFPSEELLSESLITHLIYRGSDPLEIANGHKKVRGKPLKLHYGCYAHITGQINRATFLNELVRQINIRGYYIIQPEFNNLIIVDDQNDNESHIAIDRVFFVRDEYGNLIPMESCRSLMPKSSPDGQKNNVHEGAHTKCAPIII